MLKMNKTLMIGMAVLAMTGFAGASVVDTFEVGGIDLSITPGAGNDNATDEDTGLDTDEVVGAGTDDGVREAYIERVGDGNNVTLQINTATTSGICGYSSSTVTFGNMWLKYGDRASSGADLNKDWSGDNDQYFKFGFYTNGSPDSNVTLTTTLSSGGSTATHEQTVLAGAHEILVDMADSDFSSLGANYREDIDGMTFSFVNPTSQNDFTFVFIETAPEPGTAVLLGIGAFGLLLRRHRRRRVVTA